MQFANHLVRHTLFMGDLPTQASPRLICVSRDRNPGREADQTLAWSRNRDILVLTIRVR